MGFSRVRSDVASYLCEWIRIGVITPGEDYRQPLVDLVCDNRFCMRRSDAGYTVCVAMNDPCYFCLRFGHPHQCRNIALPLVCRQCHQDREPGHTYPSRPPHFRSQRAMDADDDPNCASKKEEEAARAAAAFARQRRDQGGPLSFSETVALRANEAVLAATHK